MKEREKGLKEKGERKKEGREGGRVDERKQVATEMKVEIEKLGACHSRLSPDSTTIPTIPPPPTTTTSSTITKG